MHRLIIPLLFLALVGGALLLAHNPDMGIRFQSAMSDGGWLKSLADCDNPRRRRGGWSRAIIC